MRKRLEAQGATVTPIGIHGHLRVDHRGKMAVISTWSINPLVDVTRRWHLRRLGLEL